MNCSIEANTIVETIKNIDFGELDAYGDPNLESCFLDDNYWDKLIQQPNYFVVGRKGTGKSAIYRMLKYMGNKNGDLVAELDFGDFPFEKLLNLSDEGFAKPNQYQSIWRYMILNVFAKLIASCQTDKNEHWEKINEYVNKCCKNNIIGLHAVVIEHAKKTDSGLCLNLGESGLGFSRTYENANNLSLGNGSSNITEINRLLQSIIEDFFITMQGSVRFIIEFDRLDDNYNQYQDIDLFYQCIISLFKVVYSINQSFRSKHIFDSRILLFIRSDIYRELSKRDSESSRWDDFKLEINWAIIARHDWNNPKLLQMINKRIFNSIQNTNMSFRDIFGLNVISLQEQPRSKNKKPIDPFEYIINRTMHRPRDVIKFCKCIQSEVNNRGCLDEKVILMAERQYSAWLLNKEIANEINPVIKDLELLYSILYKFELKLFSLNELRNELSHSSLGIDAEELATVLYDIGMISNVDVRQSPYLFRSSYRNEGKFDKNQKLVLHRGISYGLKYR